MTSLDDLQALMAARIEASGLADAAARIPKRSDPHRAELSFAQRRIWMHQQLYPDSVAYNVCLCLSFTGEIDDDSLVTSFETLVDRNEALRTTFHDNDGSPYQRIHDRLPLPIDRIDLTDLDPATTADRVRALSYAAARRPFDLAQEGPMRVTFVRTTTADLTVILTVQHIAWDGMTFAALSRTVERVYLRLTSGDTTHTAANPGLQVADHADWEQANVNELDDSQAFEFWRDQLDPAPVPLVLPTDKQTPSVLSERGARVDRRMDPRCVLALSTLSRHSGTTQYTVFLTAYYLVLSRFSGATDITIGTAVANRDDAGLEELVGNFGNTLALRARLRMDTTFSQTVNQVQAITENAFAHQDYPFDRLVERLNPARVLGEPIFFQTMLLFLTQNIEGPALPGCSTRWTRVDNHTAQLPLALEVFVHGGRMDVETTYATDLFEPQTIERILDYLEQLLVTVGDNPEIPIQQLMGLTANDRTLIDRLSQQIEEPQTGEPSDPFVDDLIADRVRANPDAIAIRFEDIVLTYREFDGRVNQLTRHLLQSGIRVGDRVVVVLSRNECLPIALAAVIRAGAAYVPIDSTYPPDRVARLVTDADPALILADSRTSEQHPEILTATAGHNQQVMILDPAAAVIGDHPEIAVSTADRHRRVQHDDPALMIYTSGSTGLPKGVLISHSAIARRLRWQSDRSGNGGVFLAKSVIGFVDASTELLGALVRGGTVVVAGSEAAQDPMLLLEQIALHLVTDLVTVPALADALAATPGAQERLSSVERWICSGETLTGATVAALRRAAPRAEIVNFYGSTEVTGDATLYVSAPGDHSGQDHPDANTVPIGSPVPGTTAFVLDQFLQPVPPGVIGDLYVAGPQLAIGYHNNAARTAERFVACALRAGAQPSTRMYRTGDLARWNRHGYLEYLGRTDDQVKLRGFRIELDEVRVTAEAHPFVDSATATTFTRVAHDETSRYLVAYYTRAARCTAPEHVVSEALREHMSAHLPQHMVPAIFVELDALPKNINGKIDRKALTAPTFDEEHGRGRSPRTDTEHRVAEAISHVLSLAPDRTLHTDDNFFRLGGHSLLATRLVWKLNDALGSSLTMRDVFEAPTVAKLAAVAERLTIGSTHTVPTTPTLEEVAAGPRPEKLRLSAAQERLWFLHRASGPSSVYNISLAFEIRGSVDAHAMRSALHDLAARHEPLRTLIDDTGGGSPVQKVMSAHDIDVHFVESTDADTDVQEFLNSEAEYCFELDREIPFRAALIGLRTGAVVLSITVHHIAFDQWSGPVLFADLEDAYRSRVAGHSPSWQELPVQYADYADWQRMAAEGSDSSNGATGRQLEYWRKALAGIPDEIALPLNGPRPTVPDRVAASMTTTLPAVQTTALRTTCHRYQATEYMAANTAVAIALNLNGSGLDIPVGTPISGRGQSAVADLIGFFVNTLVIRNDLTGDPSLAEMLSRSRERVLDAFDHQDLPFERLVEALNPERSMARHPLFQTMAVYRSAGTPLRFDGNATEFVPSPATGAKFDLEFEFQESAEDLTITLTYATELFDESTARRLLETVERVLITIADDPERRLSHLATLGPDDDRKIRKWSTAPLQAAPESTLDLLLAERCAQAPDRVAINLGSNTWTYRELSAACNVLARRLIELGVGAGDRIAIMAPRSPELVVAIAGVLTTGAAYVPVDPTYPPDRVAYLLTDSDPALVLACGDSAHSMATDLTDVPVLAFTDLIDADSRTLDRPVTSEELNRPHRPSDPAYVMYTSGSTGAPKGVVISHTNVVSLFAATSSMSFTTSDVWTLFHSYSFDFSVWEIWGALLHGGRLVVVDQDTARDPSRFGQMLRDEHVTVLSQTPSAFYSLIESEDDRPGGPPESLRTIVFGGEEIDQHKISDWINRNPGSDITLFNMFGITETTVHTTVYPISSDLGPGAGLIGRPLPNLSTFVLDEYLRPAPPSATGELYVAGPQVAGGYFNRPALSASRFIANPFPDANPALRLYRTGDLARWTEDGTLEYRGRADQQVKIRGFRIELDEIRSAIEAHRDISRAAVIPRDHEADGVRGQYLVGYWVLSTTTSTTLSDTDLRTHLQSLMPAHMVPAYLMQIPEIPITANGKLDRRALPDPARDAERPTGRTPESVAEQAVAAAYAHVLGLTDVHADDDFFQLGGDSISALALVRRAGDLGVVITAPDVFTHRTVAGLASISEPAHTIEGGRAELGPPSMAHHRTSPTTAMHRQLLSPTDRSTWHHTRLLTAPPNLDIELLEASLRTVIARHAALSLAVDTHDNRPTIHYAPRDFSSPLIRCIDAATLGDAAVPDLVRDVEQEQAESLDPRGGSMTRIAYFDRGSAPGILAWTVSGFAVDDTSWRILIADLRSEYEGNGSPDRTVDFSFFAWMDDLDSSDTHEGAGHGSDRRSEQLAPAEPMNTPTAATPVRDRSMTTSVLPPDLCSALVSETALRGSSTKAVLLAGLTVAIGRWRAAQSMAANPGVLIDVESDGRIDAAAGSFDATVGCFTILRPVTVRVSDEDAVAAATEQIRHLDCLVATQAAIHAGNLGTGRDDSSRRADVRFRLDTASDGPEAGPGDSWSSPRLLPGLFAAEPPEHFLAHSLTVEVTANRSPDRTEFELRVAGDRSFTPENLHELSDLFEEEVESVVHALAVLPAGASLPTPGALQTVAPMANQHRLRRCGLPLDQFVLTEVVDLAGLGRTGTTELAAAAYACLTHHDSLQQRLIAKNSLLWTMEISAPSAQSALGMVSQHDLPALTREDAIDSARRSIRGRIDPRTGRNLHLAVVGSAEGRHLLVAIHGAVADRLSVHLVATGMASALDSGSPTADEAIPSTPEIATLLESRAQSDTADAVLDRISLLPLSPDMQTPPTNSSEAEAVLARASTAVPFNADAVSVAFARACASTLDAAGSAVDMEVDQRQFLADELAIDDKVGWLTTTCPYTTDELIAPADRPWYALVRYNHRRGRRLLKSSADPMVLLTRIYGHQADPSQREAIEGSYPIVGRFLIGRETVELEIVAADTDTAEGLVAAWLSNLEQLKTR